MEMYIISDKYIDYLSKENSHVMSNKAGERVYNRKYIGLVTKLGEHSYFVPLSSPKKKDCIPGTTRPRSDTLITIYMKNKGAFYGTVRFNFMIPVPKSELTLYNLNDEGDLKYKLLVMNEQFFLRKNSDKIEKTAKNLYERKIAALNGKDDPNPLLKLTLDFLQLEELCNAWK